MNSKYLTIIIIFLIACLLLIVFLPKQKKEIPKEKEPAREVIKKPEVEKPKEIIKAEEKAIEPKELEKPIVSDEISAKIDSGNPYRKQEAIEELVTIGDPASIRQIEDLTKDKTPSVVNRALNALGELKSEDSIPLIEEVFNTNEIRQDGYGESIRINAINALGDIGSGKSIDMLGTELSNRNLILSSYIVTALDKIGSEKSLPYLEEYQSFLTEQLANMPGAEEIGEYRFVWEQADKQVKETIDKIKGKS